MRQPRCPLSAAHIKDIQYRLDNNALHRVLATKELGLNEIWRLQLRTAVPLLCDPYSKNRTIGSFILIDKSIGVTVGCGMINEGLPVPLRTPLGTTALDECKCLTQRRTARCAP